MAKKKNRCIKTVTVTDPEVLKKLKKVLKLVLIDADSDGKQVIDQYVHGRSEIRTSLDTLEKGSSLSFEKKCVMLTNQCIYSHRFEDAAKLLWIVAHSQEIYDVFLFKAGQLVLENRQYGNQEEALHDYLFALQNISSGHSNKKEVQLEYMLYGLKQDDLEIQQKAKGFLNGKRLKSVRTTKTFEPIYQAYNGMQDYLKWQEFSNTQAVQAKAFAIKTIAKFNELIEQPGQWDVFILKLIEMMDACDESEEIEEILLKYIENNPEHINAYIYIVLYLLNQNCDDEKLWTHLESLADLCPSDPRILLLLDRWNETEKKKKKCIEHLFMFLDYPSNGSNPQAWMALLKHLHLAVKSENMRSFEVLKSCWAFRVECWDWMYFRSSPLHTEIDKELTALKIDVISFFKSDHAYVKSMLEAHPELSDLLQTPKSMKNSLS